MRWLLLVLFLILLTPTARPADCGCGGKCGGKTCVCTPTAAAPTADERYAEFRGRIARGEFGFLFVGVQKAGRYGPVCQVPAGFNGIAAGEYECYRDEAGKAVMVPAHAPVPMAAPQSSCPGGNCPNPASPFRFYRR